MPLPDRPGKTPNLDRIAKVLEPQDCLNFRSHYLIQRSLRNPDTHINSINKKQ